MFECDRTRSIQNPTCIEDNIQRDAYTRSVEMSLELQPLIKQPLAASLSVKHINFRPVRCRAYVKTAKGIASTSAVLIKRVYPRERMLEIELEVNFALETKTLSSNNLCSHVTWSSKPDGVNNARNNLYKHFLFCF